ncbi:hypothetical protein JCM9279_003839 [Rhodotorula babjevae]
MPPWPDTYPFSFFAPFEPSPLAAAAISPPDLATSARSTGAGDAHLDPPALAAAQAPAAPAASPPLPHSVSPPRPRPRPPASTPPLPSLELSPPPQRRPVASSFFGPAAGDAPQTHAVPATPSSSSTTAATRDDPPFLETAREPGRGATKKRSGIESRSRRSRSPSARRRSERRGAESRWAPSTAARSSHLYDDDLGPSTFASSAPGPSEPRYAATSASDEGRWRRSPRRRTRSPSLPARTDSRLSAVEPRRASMRSMPPAFVDRPASARSDREREPDSLPHGPRFAPPSASPLQRLDENVAGPHDSKRRRIVDGSAAPRAAPPPAPRRSSTAHEPEAQLGLRNPSRAPTGGMSLSDRWDALDQARAVQSGGGGTSGRGRRRRGGKKHRRSSAAAAADRARAGGDDCTMTTSPSRGEAEEGPRVSLDDGDGLVFDFAAEPPRRRAATSPTAEDRPAPARRDHRRRGGSSTRPHAARLDLSPSLGGLKQHDFKSLLLERPVEPMWNLGLYRLVLKLITSIRPPDLWPLDTAALSSMSATLIEPDWLASSVLSHQPDKVEVRAACGGSPGRAIGFASLSRAVYDRFLAMVDVVRWLFEDRSVGEPETAYVMLHAPREIRILVSHFADVVLFSELVQRHERTLIGYLSRLSSPSPLERASLTLLEWLNTTARPDRHYLFLCEADGRLRGEKTGVEPWRWWVVRAQAGRSTAVEVLDEWETDMLSMEKW